ncbi:hypothetical protein [Frankia sp. Cj3]|uniref:hypothetical protein n=1 Tax=Frankia sp. Cj3 TaxID=2880976 RepID=UPI001EF6E723|nr:hypothetical protein [Frankia sp. Cj3]
MNVGFVLRWTCPCGQIGHQHAFGRIRVRMRDVVLDGPLLPGAAVCSRCDQWFRGRPEIMVDRQDMPEVSEARDRLRATNRRAYEAKLAARAAR